jgi:hypothetical protein
LLRATAAAACALLCPAALADLDDLKFRISADAAYDDNVTRASGDDRLDDSFGALSLGASYPWQWSRNTRLVLNASAGADRFRRYRGLDRAYGVLQAELQYRDSAWFDAPIWGLLVRQGIDEYDSSELRDGYRTSVAITLRQPLTDRVFLFGALAYNQRDGRSTVFDTQEVSLRGSLDYSLTRQQTLYFGLEARVGDIVSTARPSLAFLDIADAVIVDDAFTDTTRLAYRIEATTGILTLGYNIAFGEKVALDLAYLGAYSRPKQQPPASVQSEKVYYTANQVIASLLFRF